MTPTDPDDDLRRALHDAVSDVQPHGTLDDIRSRTDKVIPMATSGSRRWFLPTLTAAAVMVAVVGGAFWLVNDDDDPSGDVTTTPSDTPSASTPTQSAEPDLTERAVPVYYVGDGARGPRLFREFQRKQICAGQECLVKASAVAAVSGEPDDTDYRTLWPAGATVGKVGYDGDVLTVDLAGDLHDRPGGMSGSDADLAVQQLIFSAQAGLGEGRVPVQLLLDGSHTDTVLGVPSSEPLAAANPDDVQAPVQIDSPSEGDQVPGTFTVTGRAAAFEANVIWELKQGNTVVKQGFATAEECCTLAPYSFEVTDVAAGSYTLVVHDEDMSGEGRPVNEDTKEITVQ